MTVVEQAARKARQHTVYLLADGTRVPGVTTITGIMDKPALVNWANNLGLQGIKVREYVDELATIGTLAHALIEAYLKGEKMDTGDYSPNQLDLANNGVIKFMYWQERSGFKPLHSEMKLVSEKNRYGGTVDAYGTIGDRRVLMDIKTAKAVYDDMFTQVAGGYALLLEENGYPVDDVLIVRVGRSADEGEHPEEQKCQCRELHERRFLVCRELYDLNQKIKKGGA